MLPRLVRAYTSNGQHQRYTQELTTLRSSLYSCLWLLRVFYAKKLNILLANNYLSLDSIGSIED